MISVELYNRSMAQEWDDFVEKSRNATFLFKRQYMDYHSDRFEDCSLVFREVSDKATRIISILPASRHGDKVISHGGLTYGGFVLPAKGVDGGKLLKILEETKCFYRSMSINKLRYKAIPYIYHHYPSDEDQYALFRNSARLVECNLSSVIDLTAPYDFDERSRRNLKKAVAAGFTVSGNATPDDFWHVLETVLRERHDTAPVHTAEEMKILQSRFPDNIRVFVVRNAGGEVVAGTVLYDTVMCVHSQYIASLSEGRTNGALALLFNYLIKNECGNSRYFDFGTSNEDHGNYLNEGLLQFKNGLGGRGVAYNIFELDI